MDAVKIDLPLHMQQNYHYEFSEIAQTCQELGTALIVQLKTQYDPEFKFWSAGRLVDHKLSRVKRTFSRNTGTSVSPERTELQLAAAASWKSCQSPQLKIAYLLKQDAFVMPEYLGQEQLMANWEALGIEMTDDDTTEVSKCFG